MTADRDPAREARIREAIRAHLLADPRTLAAAMVRAASATPKEKTP